MIRTAVSLAVAAALFLAGPAPLLAVDEKAERLAIEGVLAAHIVEGHRARKAELVMGAYLPDAEVCTYISGKIDCTAFGALVAKELSGYVSIVPVLEIQELTFPSENEALARILLKITGERADGKKVERSERPWLLLRKGAAGWRIQKSGYRSDFSVSEGAHKNSPHR